MMGTATERVLAVMVLLTVQFVYCSAQGGCSPPAGILMTGDDKLTNNVSTILTDGLWSIYLRPKFGGQGTDWWTVYSETQVRDHGLWCQVLPSQSPPGVTDIGDWYYPPGDTPDGFTLVPTTSSSSVPYQSLKCTHQFGLLRINNIVNNQGIVKCNTTFTNIPRTTNYILVYSDDVYNNYNGPTVDPTMKLFLLTSRDTESNLMFTLSFTVSYGVPSRLHCVDVGNNVILFSQTLSRGPTVSQLSREVIRSHYINSSYADMTRVSITRTGQSRAAAATYTCTVYVEGRVNPGNRSVYNFRQMGNAVTTASITVAATPTSVMATRTGFDSVNVSWTAPSPAPTIYEVFYQATGSSTRLSGGTTSNTALTLTGLSLESYSIFVVGSGTDGGLILPSAHSNTATVMIDIPQLASVPTLAPSSTSIMVSWTPTLVSPSSYKVNSSCQLICGSSPVQQTDTVSGSLTEHTITSIAPGSTCTVCVTVVFGGSVISNTVASSTNTTSAAPTGAPEGLTSTSVESRSLSVVWGTVPCPHQGGSITGYRLRYSNGTSIVNTTGEESRQHVLTGLASFTSHSVQVAAINDGGTGPYSTPPLNVETLQDVPGPVSGLSATPGVVQLTISWSPSSEPNGIITMYQVSYNISGVLNYTNTSATQHTLRDLPPNTVVTFSVRAYTIIGPGEAVSNSASTTDIPPISIDSVLRISNTSVRVTWTPLNLPVVDHYTVHYSICVSNFSTTFPASVSSGMLSGLMGGLQFQFSVSVTLRVSGQLYMGVPGPSMSDMGKPSTSSLLSLPETLTAIPSPTCPSCPSCPSSAVGYSAGLGVISIILITSLLGNVTLLVIVVLNIRKWKCSNKKPPLGVYKKPGSCSKDDIEMRSNTAYGTVESQYEDVNMSDKSQDGPIYN